MKLSNEGGYIGHITNNGPAELRTNMVQVVMGMLRVQRRLHNVSLIIDYTRMKKAQGIREEHNSFCQETEPDHICDAEDKDRV